MPIIKLILLLITIGATWFGVYEVFIHFGVMAGFVSVVGLVISGRGLSNAYIAHSQAQKTKESEA